MKDANIKVLIEQLATEIEKEANQETSDNYARECRLLDAKEYLRRAWHSVDDSEFVANDTAYEQMKPVASGPAMELLTHRVNIALRPVNRLSKKRSGS